LAGGHDVAEPPLLAHGVGGADVAGKTRVNEPAGQVDDIQKLDGRVQRTRHQHWSVRVAVEAPGPVAEAVAAIAVSADQAGPGDQEPVGHGFAERVLAGHLALAVLLDGGLVGGQRGQHFGGLIGVRFAVVLVHGEAGHVDPAASAVG
jgi:hypothetical protein